MGVRARYRERLKSAEPPGDRSDEDVVRAVSSNTFWYHTFELRTGVVTPGWFDLRSIVDLLPWPDVRGKRCLDVGTYDGFLAFELERRGAAEIVATDIANHEDWDWPPAVRARGVEYLRQVAGEKGRGFEIAAWAYGSRVVKRDISVYDLRPETVGRFDVVVCGSLLLHLRDPLRALEAIRSVCRGHLMSTEEIDLVLTITHPRRAVSRFGPTDRTQWHVPNLSGHRAMISAAGFAIERVVRPYAVRFGPGHPPRRARRSLIRHALRRAVLREDGVPHSAVLARSG
jgi:tRNA (mo5U34)-methyltransferase